jgi:hypothetical protein
VLIDWPADFDRYLDVLETEAQRGDRRAAVTLDLLVAQLGYLESLEGPPSDDTATLKLVRQSRRHDVWRLSHPFREGVAVRTIVWFAPDGRVVVTLFSNDKAQMGDVFYASVGARADQIIDRWLREREDER